MTFCGTRSFAPLPPPYTLYPYLPGLHLPDQRSIIPPSPLIYFQLHTLLYTTPLDVSPPNPSPPITLFIANHHTHRSLPPPFNSSSSITQLIPLLSLHCYLRCTTHQHTCSFPCIPHTHLFSPTHSPPLPLPINTCYPIHYLSASPSISLPLFPLPISHPLPSPHHSSSPTTHSFRHLPHPYINPLLMPPT